MPRMNACLAFFPHSVFLCFSKTWYISRSVSNAAVNKHLISQKKKEYVTHHAKRDLIGTPDKIIKNGMKQAQAGTVR